MIKIGKLTDYAIVVLSHMARNEQQLFAAAELSAATGIASPTVAKVLKLLHKRGLLHSIRGAKGGYRLALVAEQTKLSAIIAAMEGPIAMTECTGLHDHCRQTAGCGVRGHWLVISRVIQAALDAVTLAEMAKPVSPSHPPGQPVPHPVAGRSR